MRLNPEGGTGSIEGIVAVPPRRSMRPDILLGIDYLHHIKLRFKETKPCGYSVYDSTIGPFVCGQANEPNEGNVCLATVMATLATANEEQETKPKIPKKDVELYELMQRYFTMESAGYLGDDNDPSEDEMVHAKFLETIKYEETRDPGPNDPPWTLRGRSTMEDGRPQPGCEFRAINGTAKNHADQAQENTGTAGEVQSDHGRSNQYWNFGASALCGPLRPTGQTVLHAPPTGGQGNK